MARPFVQSKTYLNRTIGRGGDPRETRLGHLSAPETMGRTEGYERSARENLH